MSLRLTGSVLARVLTLTLLSLGLCACASPVPAPCEPVQVEAAKLSPPPSAVMVQRTPNFRQRLLDAFSSSPTTPTPSSSSSPPAKP